MTTQNKITTVKAMLQTLKDIQANEVVISDCNRLLDNNPEDTIALNWRRGARDRATLLQIKYEQLLNELTEEKEPVL